MKTQVLWGVLLVGTCRAAPTPTPLPLPLRAALAADQPAVQLVIAPVLPHGAVGDTLRFGAMLIVAGQSVSCAPVLWESLNPEVASITRDGLATVHRAGSATIRAICEGHLAGTTGTFGP